MKRSPIRISLLYILLFIVPLFGQNSDADQSDLDRGYLMVSGGVGSTSFSIADFEKVYVNRPLDKVAIAAVGARSAAIVAKFREVRASGQSIVKNVQSAGASQWYQRYWEAGFRFRSDRLPFYMDILYFLTTAREDIGMATDPITALTDSHTEKQRGVAAALGIAIPLIPPVRLFGEAEYGMVIKKESQDGTASTAPELGGFRLAGGVQIAF